MEECNFSFWYVRLCDLNIPRENVKIFENSGDPYLHCLPITLFGISRIKWVKKKKTSGLRAMICSRHLSETPIAYLYITCGIFPTSSQNFFFTYIRIKKIIKFWLVICGTTRAVKWDNCKSQMIFTIYQVYRSRCTFWGAAGNRTRALTIPGLH